MRTTILLLTLSLWACANTDPAGNTVDDGRRDSGGEEEPRRDIGSFDDVDEPTDADPGDVLPDSDDIADGSAAPADADAETTDVPDADAADTAVPDAPDSTADADASIDADADVADATPPPACCVETCGAGGTCITSPGACADECGTEFLRTSRDCSGCGAAGASGVCTDDRVFTCNATNNQQCISIPCGGRNYYCTLQAGEWAWRETTGCDDRNPCTAGDTCAAGICAGTTFSCETRICPADRCEAIALVDFSDTCAQSCDGAGGCTDCECAQTTKLCTVGPTNECCVPSCDPVAGCRTAPGNCGGGDVCTNPNQLQIANACTGCGGDGANGICSGGGTEICDASTPANLCRQVTCGGQSYSCTNVGGVTQWRTSSLCDDGNLCTHTDNCQAGTCRGNTVTCTDTDCLDRECNGTVTCTQNPLTGRSCDDANVCTAGDTCTVAGVCGAGASAAVCGDTVCNCGETNASCSADCPITLPPNACATGSQSRIGCGNARIIGRQQARAGWASGSQNTCSGARDDFDGECSGIFDVGSEHMYAIYMQAGERVAFTWGVGTARCPENRGERVELQMRMKWRFNPNTTTAGATACPAPALSCVAGPNFGQSITNTRDYTATQDGWLFLIVDGGSSGLNYDRGYYTLNVTLSRCSEGTCGCP